MCHSCVGREGSCWLQVPVDVSQLCGEGKCLWMCYLCGEGRVLLAASACGCVTVVWGGEGLAVDVSCVGRGGQVPVDVSQLCGEGSVLLLQVPVDVSQLCGEGSVLLLQVPVDVSQLCGEGRVLLLQVPVNNISVPVNLSVVWGRRGGGGGVLLAETTREHVRVVWKGEDLFPKNRCCM